MCSSLVDPSRAAAWRCGGKVVVTDVRCVSSGDALGRTLQPRQKLFKTVSRDSCDGAIGCRRRRSACRIVDTPARTESRRPGRIAPWTRDDDESAGTPAARRAGARRRRRRPPARRRPRDAAHVGPPLRPGAVRALRGRAPPLLRRRRRAAARDAPPHARRRRPGGGRTDRPGDRSVQPARSGDAAGRPRRPRPTAVVDAALAGDLRRAARGCSRSTVDAGRRGVVDRPGRARPGRAGPAHRRRPARGRRGRHRARRRARRAARPDRGAGRRHRTRRSSSCSSPRASRGRSSRTRSPRRSRPRASTRASSAARSSAHHAVELAAMTRPRAVVTLGERADADLDRRAPARAGPAGPRRSSSWCPDGAADTRSRSSGPCTARGRSPGCCTRCSPSRRPVWAMTGPPAGGDIPLR